MTRRRVCLAITSVGGTLIPATLEILRRSALFDYRLVGINAAPAPLAEPLLDAFCILPRGDAPTYAEELLAAVRREKIEILLPWSDEEATTVASLSKELGKLGCRALTASSECLDRISSKRATYEQLAKAGLRSPAFEPVADVASLVKAVEGFGYPARTVVVKPSKGRGGRGLQVLLGQDRPPTWLGAGQRETRWSEKPSDERGFSAFFDFGPELLVMPCLGVPAYDADVVIFGGDPLVVVRRRHNPTGIPFQGNTLVADPEMSAYCMAAARALGLEALHDIDFMTGPDGLPVVLEVNPRPSGSLGASLAAGYPVIDWAVARISGIPFEVRLPTRDIDILPMVVPRAIQN